MEILFRYKNKIISTPNLEKKLKRMKISIDDIEIIEDIKKEKEDTEYNDIKKYHFINTKNGYTITSIYSTLPEWIENKKEWKKLEN